MADLVYQPFSAILMLKIVERGTVVVADVERGESSVLLQTLRQDSKSESEHYDIESGLNVCLSSSNVIQSELNVCLWDVFALRRHQEAAGK